MFDFLMFSSGNDTFFNLLNPLKGLFGLTNTDTTDLKTAKEEPKPNGQVRTTEKGNDFDITKFKKIKLAVSTFFTQNVFDGKNTENQKDVLDSPEEKVRNEDVFKCPKKEQTLDVFAKNDQSKAQNVFDKPEEKEQKAPIQNLHNGIFQTGPGSRIDSPSQKINPDLAKARILDEDDFTLEGFNGFKKPVLDEKYQVSHAQHMTTGTILALLKENKELKRENKELKAEKAKLPAEDPKPKDVTELEERYKELLEKNKALEKKYQELKEDYQGLRNKFQQSEANVTASFGIISQNANELSNAKKEIFRIKKDLEEKDKKIFQMEQELKVTRQEYQDKIQNIEYYSGEKTKEIKNLKSQLATHELLLSESQKLGKDDESKDLKKEIETLKGEVASSQEVIRIHKKENIQLYKRIEILETRLKKYEPNKSSSQKDTK